MMGLRRSNRPRPRACLGGALVVAALGLSEQSLAAGNLSCSVTTPATLSFGAYGTTNDLTVPMTMTVSCGGFGQTNSVNYVLSASAGTGSYSGRQLLNGGNIITYNLFTTSGETAIWGDGSSGTLTLTGTVTKQAPSVNVTIYGLIRGGQNVVPGSYATTTNINVTLTYTF